MSDELINSASFPLYLQVVGRIQHAIDSGKYAVGDPIPTELELCEKFSVSRITVRRAVAELVKAGYLVKKQGKGTFVRCAGNLRMVQSRTEMEVFSFTEACQRAGFEPGSIELGHFVADADEKDQAFFDCAPGTQVVCLRRVHCANGIPIMLTTSRFPLPDFGFLRDVDLTNKSLYQLIQERTGRVPRMVGECVISSDRAHGDLPGWLSVPAGEPLFREVAQFADERGCPLYREEEIIVGARYSFSL